MIGRKTIILPFLVLLAALMAGCGLFRSSGADEDYSLPTEIGVPNGSVSTMTIGSKGGVISSEDGRVKLTIPPNLLAADIEFSIQPISNNTEGVVGNAYRLEPNGQKFERPVTLSFNFADGDLQGAESASLAVAYQDGEGRWRSLKTVYIDDAGKSITALTTHFTDVVVKKGSWWIGDPDKHRARWEGKKRGPLPDISYLKQLSISPKQATVYVGETLPIKLIGCRRPNLLKLALNRLNGFKPCIVSDASGSEFNAIDPYFIAEGSGDYGYVFPDYGVHETVYHAPKKKPSPNFATVYVVSRIFSLGEWKDLGQWPIDSMTIMILDRGYRVRGTSHDEVYSGVICDLEKPFIVKAAGLANFDITFTPSGPTSGSTSYSLSNQWQTEIGNGLYRTNDEATGLSISWRVVGTATEKVRGGKFSGPSIVKLDLEPLPANDISCN